MKVSVPGTACSGRETEASVPRTACSGRETEASVPGTARTVREPATSVPGTACSVLGMATAVRGLACITQPSLLASRAEPTFETFTIPAISGEIHGTELRLRFEGVAKRVAERMPGRQIRSGRADLKASILQG